MDFSTLIGPGPASNSPTSLSAVPSAGVRSQSAGKLLSPDNPLLWYGALAAITFGAMAFSTSVRVGHTTGSLNLGSTS